MATHFIVGGSSGIGLSLAKQLHEEGHNVYASYNRTHTTHEGIRYFPLNVTDENPDLAFLPEALDSIVYCPGSIVLKPFTRIAPDDFMNDYQLQVIGAVKMIQKVLPLLKKGSDPSVLLFSTVAVQTGMNFHSMVAANKGAIEGLTRALAAEFAPGIRVNCIAPSLTDTPLASNLLSSLEKKDAGAARHPLKKIGSPEEIAALAAFLLSEKASWITGQIIHADGGMSSLKP